ncbi:MAG: M48 family metalloprotease [Methylococcaceae bacterium]|nr:M48 family metalloprotease [Methylococcaceae bacterium]
MFKRSAIALALSLALFPALPQAVEIDKIELPEMGDSSGSLLTIAEEKELGEEFFRYLHSELSINQDAEIQEYIQTIGNRLATNSDTPGYPFHFFVVMENDINAFAGPGGYIGVNSGLILMTEAESELASVMAHEIAHVTQRHLYRGVEAQQRLSIPTMAATLAAIALGTQSPQMGQAALMAIQAGNVQFQIDFTRAHEEEADRVGMQTLSGSDYDPRSMPTFFERLQQSSRYYGKDIPEFLRTHPVTASRISDTRGRAETYPYKQYPDSLAYQLTRAKIRVLTDTNTTEVQKYFQTKLNQGTSEQRTVAQYGMGLVALAMQKYSDAEAIFQSLVKTYPNQVQYGAALARTALEARNYDVALDRYKKLIGQFPNKEAIKLEYAESLLKTGNANQAQKVLLALNPDTQRLPVYTELLAQVYGNLHQAAESHRYLAEHYYSTGHTPEAILQIRLAKNSKGLTPQLNAILNERLSFFVNKEKEAAKQ